ncbi:NrsF family protein [Rhodoplanes sp. TEM]|uniref:NrsF family protein n=1 Tax=Rhodoplanes tepidamans TaxID=200616 RepID=A0ABT5JBM4_RHOTP|nr:MULTISPECIES: NrsF family protein [Rhodoplanes]MDC7787093.1 NrsF family protein [Rhodoplanes tepidamans]MDC7986314.1 NrsF family protein [Rhodoplanes sp. TEM]MDQ0358693.1 hypothetical protein [Rhodoplanes tepidamans]
MKTDDLVRALAADAAVRERPLAVALPVAAAAGLAVALALFAVALGPRPDIATAAQTLRFVLKPVEMGLFAIVAVVLAVRLAEPGAPVRRLVAGLAAPAGLLGVAVTAELATVPSAEWGRRLVGTNARVCLVSIPLLAAPVLVASLWALRRGAPVHPAGAGAAAGLFSASVAAALYALHCGDDSPLFVATWYSLATVLVVAAGALAGRRLLRW